MIRTPQALALLVLAAIPACDCTTPRGKPWRHEPDPASLAAAEPRSPALVRDQAATAVLAERDHTLRVQMESEPRTLNPLVSPTVWARRITMGTVFEPLIRYEPPAGGAGAGPGQYAPGLARSWRVMPDGKEIRLYLEPGVKFHDGRTMTSVDVQFTLDAIRSPRFGVDHLRPYFKDVWAVELITAREVRIVLLRPNGWVLRALAEIPILPAHVYERGFAAGGRIVGTGPWQLASWKDGVVHLARFAGYWGEAPAISDLEFVYEPDAARALTEAKRGAYDVIPSLIPAHWPEQASAPGITSAFTALELRPPRMRYLAFNCAAPPLDDPRVRHALALLIDRRKMARDVLDTLARPVAFPIWPGGPGDGPELPAPEHDPAAAGRLLDAAGWIDSDKDGVRDKGGQRLHVTMLIREDDEPEVVVGPRADPERAVVLEPFKRAGISIERREGPEAVLANRVRAGDFGLATLEVALPVDMDLSPLLHTRGALNGGGCGSPRIDAALDALELAWEPKARALAIGELTAALAETWPLAGIVAAAPQGLVHRRVEGVVVWDGWIDLRKLRFSQ